ncbi:MAG: hypothetical protein WC815_12610 [Vicinamibacterales bacterium]|jgi:ketosteroid isomerase-like protein
MSKKTTGKKPTSRRSKTKWDPGLVKAHKGYVDAINSNNTDRVMAMYDKGIAVMQPDGPLVTGRGPVRKWVADYFKTTKTHWVKKSTAMWVGGDYGFDQGIDSAVDIPRAGGPTLRYTVKGILIYKRQKNGGWLVYRDIWNNNSPSRP